MKRVTICVVGAVACALGGPARAQQFNVDVDFPNVPPSLGGGVPSSAFGAASGQAGTWNSMDGASNFAYPLVDINNNVTGATLTLSNSSGLLGFNNGSNSGDYALLMNDATQIGTVVQGGSATFTFAGLFNGFYTVYTYGAPPQGSAGSTVVDVVGSTSTNPQTLIGGASANFFGAGQTHAIHNVLVTNGTITIRITDPNGDGLPAYINGFQLVPAPGAIALGAVALSVGARRRRA